MNSMKTRRTHTFTKTNTNMYNDHVNKCKKTREREKKTDATSESNEKIKLVQKFSKRPHTIDIVF